MLAVHDCSCTLVLHFPSVTSITYWKSQLKQQHDKVRKQHVFFFLSWRRSVFTPLSPKSNKCCSRLSLFPAGLKVFHLWGSFWMSKKKDFTWHIIYKCLERNTASGWSNIDRQSDMFLTSMWNYQTVKPFHHVRIDERSNRTISPKTSHLPDTKMIRTLTPRDQSYLQYFTKLYTSWRPIM